MLAVETSRISHEVKVSISSRIFERSSCSPAKENSAIDFALSIVFVRIVASFSSITTCVSGRIRMISSHRELKLGSLEYVCTA